jgi:hypothetical protein
MLLLRYKENKTGTDASELKSFLKLCKEFANSGY